MQVDTLTLPPASWLPFIYGANICLGVLGLSESCFSFSLSSMRPLPRFPPLSPSYLVSFHLTSEILLFLSGSLKVK